MSELQLAIIGMCLMGIAFAACIKLLFDAFIVHLTSRSELTTKAINQAGAAIELNGRTLKVFTELVSAQGSNANG